MSLGLQDALASRRAAPTPYPDQRFSGRGIVTCAGGLRYFTCAWVLVHVLRRALGSTLPIQVWHAGRGEMSEGMQCLLEEAGVEVVDAQLVAQSRGDAVRPGWPLKPYAVQQCRFEEVLFLDADCVPLVNLDGLFDWAPYREAGLLLWPDILDLRHDNPVWQRFGLEPSRCISVESSVMIFEKRRAWPVLDLATLLNAHCEELYDVIYGDKDSFLLAARLAGRGLPLVPHRPFQVDGDLVQRDLQGDPLVQHRTASKWNLLGTNTPAPIADLDAVCTAAIADLRQRWSGAVFNPPERSPCALDMERALAETRRFRYTSRGSTRVLELLTAGRIGAGRAEREQHWAVVDREPSMVLQFYSRATPTVEFTRRDDGSWRAEAGSDADAMLVPETLARRWPDSEDRGSSAPAIAALLAPWLFATGFDADVARELDHTLALLARQFDDVGEAVRAWADKCGIGARWRRHLDATLAALPQRSPAPATAPAASNALDGPHYHRVP